MWPDHETSQDFLGFEHLVGVLTDLVTTPQLLPATVGVYGDWGSGKSSLLQMATERLGARNDILVITFNGWLFEGYDDAKAALMETIIGQLEQAASKNKGLADKVKGLLARLRVRVSWLRLGAFAVKAVAGAATGPAGLAALGFDAFGKQLLKDVGAAKAEDLAKIVQEDPGRAAHQSVRDFREDFAATLSQMSLTAVVVVIDDLDRCPPDTVIQTLEAIKLFLFAPRTAFVLGADERLIRHAVRQRFPVVGGSERTEVGRDYLEKLVQYPLRVPPMGRAEITSYVGLLFAEASGMAADVLKRCRDWTTAVDRLRDGKHFGASSVQDIGVTVDDALMDDLRIAERIAPMLAVGLNGNPRQCKRFLNTLLMRMKMATARGLELQQRVLAKLMLLEYFQPQTFRRLAQLQAEQYGRPVQLAALEALIKGPPGQSDQGKTADSSSASPGSPERTGKTHQPQPAKREPTDEEVTAWAADQWLSEWVSLEPQLEADDLRPYFYLARDTVNPMTAAVQRLSPEAQKCLTLLEQPGEAVQPLGLKAAKDLSAADAAAIYQVLSEQVHQVEDLCGDDDVLKRLCKYVEARPELAGQLVTLIRNLPENGLPISLPPAFAAACKNSPVADTAAQIIESWTHNDQNARLAKAASIVKGRQR